MRNYLFIMLTLSAMLISCDRDEPNGCGEPQLQLTEIDMSSEVDENYYTYFRVINKTGVPIVFRAVQLNTDIGVSSYMENYHDGILYIYPIGRDFKCFSETVFPFVEIKYNYNEETGESSVLAEYRGDTPGNILDDDMWSKEIIDENSIVRTFVFTEQMYNDALAE